MLTHPSALEGMKNISGSKPLLNLLPQERADMQVERAGGRLHAVQRRDRGAGGPAARGVYRVTHLLAY